MKVLHTADLHIGRSLYTIPRHTEFSLFFDWLITILIEQEIDILLIAGDIFDTGTPSNRSMEIYFKFLADIAQKTPCQHVVIIGGNHDSPAVLGSSERLLKSLNIHVIGGVTENIADEILLLHDAQNNPSLIVCAVPFLKERDIRLVEDNESREEKSQRLVQGIEQHYTEIFSHARTLQEQQEQKVPIIAMGHLYIVNGEKYEGDGVRELYVGSLSQISASIFPDWLDYVALGHLHIPHCVGTQEHIRYSGSPLVLGFHESHYEKSVTVVELSADCSDIAIMNIPVPRLRKILSIRGELPTILARMQELQQENEPAWLEIIYTGVEVIGDLRQIILDRTADTCLQVLKIDNTAVKNITGLMVEDQLTLQQLDPLDVFHKFLVQHDVPETQYASLNAVYQSIVESIQTEEAMQMDELAAQLKAQ